MDVDITSTDTDEINVAEIRAALEGAGYFVQSITVRDRHGDPVKGDEYEGVETG